MCAPCARCASRRIFSAARRYFRGATSYFRRVSLRLPDHGTIRFHPPRVDNLWAIRADRRHCRGSRGVEPRGQYRRRQRPVRRDCDIGGCGCRVSARTSHHRDVTQDRQPHRQRPDTLCLCGGHADACDGQRSIGDRPLLGGPVHHGRFPDRVRPSGPRVSRRNRHRVAKGENADLGRIGKADDPPKQMDFGRLFGGGHYALGAICISHICTTGDLVSDVSSWANGWLLGLRWG